MEKMGFTLIYKSSYDYKYNGDDADKLLCKSLNENNLFILIVML